MPVNKNKRILYVFSTLILLFVVVLAGCASNSNDESSNNNSNVPNTGANSAQVDVNMTSYQFQPESTKVPAGPVTFHVTNADQANQHEMVVLKTDLEGQKLPTNDQGLVDEDKLQSMGEVEVEQGNTKDLNLNLTPGHYVLLCNEPGHYEQGMYLDITAE